MADFFTSIGRTLGEVIRFVVDLLTGAFSGLGDSARGFLQGLSSALGISPSLLNIVVLLIGLWMLWRCVRALLRRALIAAIVWGVLSLALLSWLIN